MSGVILIGCVSAKQDRPARARDLYVSPLFKKRRVYAESSLHPWGIISAKYGLLLPDDIARPYDLALTQLSAQERVEWGERVRAQIARDFGRPEFVEVHAGSIYVKSLGEVAGSEMRAPLAGLSIGRQLAWYVRWQHSRGQR